MESVGKILKKNHSELLVSKQRLRQSESVLMVRRKRESRNQELGYSSRPFVLCGLPVKRPAKGTLIHERRNGRFVLQVIGHPTYGLPGVKTVSSLSSSPLLRPDKSRPASRFRAPPTCWTPSVCSRAAPSIDV